MSVVVQRNIMIGAGLTFVLALAIALAALADDVTLSRTAAATPDYASCSSCTARHQNRHPQALNLPGTAAQETSP
ncbi:MAG: hypothetical protein WAO69_00040 [Aestuariivita sp.]|uniref:hypothetical protein n=1 Tax=Aestuariivita sp. TaxID=1872407 RepID=UPI003BAEA027